MSICSMRNVSSPSSICRSDPAAAVRCRAALGSGKDSCWWAISRSAGGASPRGPRVILVRVKKARDLLLQFRRVARLTHGNGVFEKLPLDGCRQIIPLQKDRRPKALQDTLLFLREGHGFVAAWFFRCWPRRTSFAFPSGKGAGQRIARLTSLWCLGDHACNMGCGRVRRHWERGKMQTAPERPS